MSVSMPPTAQRKATINTLIKSLQDAGIWDLLDVMWVLAAHSPEASLLNWKSPGTFTGVPANTPTWQADRGYTGNGTTSRIDTTWTPSTNAVNFVQDNASLGLWVNSDVSGSGFDFGSQATHQARINSRNASNLVSYLVNDQTADDVPGASTSVGFVHVMRTSATALSVFKNGVSLGSDTRTSTGLPSNSLWICAANASPFSTRQVSFASAGASLSGREAAFYAAVLAYMQAVGAA